MPVGQLYIVQLLRLVLELMNRINDHQQEAECQMVNGKEKYFFAHESVSSSLIVKPLKA